MNEEEMIKIIKYHSCYDISEEDKKTKSWEYIDISGDEFHEFRNALIQLLDLYKQEKEKNKKLEEENKYLQDYLEGMEGGLKEQIKEQSRVIAELEEQLQES